MHKNSRGNILPCLCCVHILELFRPVTGVDRSQGTLLNSEALFEEDGGIDHHVDVVLWLRQRVVVVVHIHLHRLTQSLESMVVLISLARWHSQIILAYHEIDRGCDIVDMADGGLAPHEVESGGVGRAPQVGKPSLAPRPVRDVSYSTHASNVGDRVSCNNCLVAV